MAQTTVLGGTASDVMVTVTGTTSHSAASQLSSTVNRVMDFVNRQVGNSSPSSSDPTSGSFMSNFGSGSVGNDSLSARGLGFQTFPSIGQASQNNEATSQGTLISGKGSATLTLQGVVSDFTNPYSDQKVVDSSAGGNRIVIDQGSVAAHNSVGDTISAAAKLVITGGSNEHISAGGHLDFLDGTGTSYISAHDAMIFGTSNSVYHFVGKSLSNVLGDNASGDYSTFSGTQDSNGNYVHDILFDASSSHGAFAATVGNRDTIIGGTASDTFYIDADSKASGQGQDVSATLTGGSGAANLFQFMDNEGGHYTITDFGSAAGNLVAFKGTKQDLTNALDNATIEGGNTTIRLKDKTEITFLDDTHLKASDFTLLPPSS